MLKLTETKEVYAELDLMRKAVMMGTEEPLL
jgi:hypothetical protein